MTHSLYDRKPFVHYFPDKDVTYNRNHIVIHQPNELTTYDPNASHESPPRGISHKIKLFIATTAVLTYTAYKLVSFARINRLWSRCKQWCWNRLSSFINHNNSIRTVLTMQNYRNAFRETPTPKLKKQVNAATHPESAAWRNSAMTFLKRLCISTGAKPFSHQQSNADVRDGVAGSRDYRWAKDTVVPSSSSTPNPNHIIGIVDVDYYMDMVDYLLQHDNPVFLYTFQPQTVACNVGEFTFCFDSDDTVTYQVSGGASYQHKVWNYSGDVITVSSSMITKTYLVERRLANAHHQYVLLIPTGKWTGFAAWVVNYISHDQLTRLRVSQNGYNVLDNVTRTGVVRSIALTNELNHAEISRQSFESLVTVAKTQKLALGLSTVESRYDNIEPELRKIVAPIILSYIRSMVPITPGVVYEPSDGVQKYQIINNLADYEPDHAAIMTAYMSPIYPGSFVPDKSLNNEKAAVKGRVLDPQIEAKLLAGTTSKWLLDEIVRFVELLIPYSHQLHPCTIEEVYEHQDRPTQRVLLEQAEAKHSDGIVRTFLKAEPYQKISDPRVISTFDPADKRDYSAYIYPLADCIAQHKWYAFGKTPLEIANIVVEICVKADTCVVLGDANRMDGHIISVVRLLERHILLRAFATEHHNAVITAQETQYRKKAVTKGGVRYKVDDQRCSGSAETALFNSIDTKFNDYIARRWLGADPKAAFDAAGLFGGDDSIAQELAPRSVSMKALTDTAAMIGQSVEGEVITKGNYGVNFLSRFYTAEVWYGDNASTCDIPRILGKLHLTPNLTQFTPLEKLQQKLSGLWLTDRHTPIIGNILNAAMRVGLNLNMPPIHGLSSYWHQFEDCVNWPNLPGKQDCDSVNHIVVYDYDAAAIINHMFGKVLDKHNVDFDTWSELMERITSPDELLSMPALLEIENVPVKTKFIAVVNEVIHEPPVINAAHSLNDNSNDPKHDDICWRWVDRNCNAGKECKLAHRKVCMEFLNKNCSRKTCKFLHVRR